MGEIRQRFRKAQGTFIAWLLVYAYLHAGS